MSILENIKGHADLLDLNDAQREQLCREIRQFLVSKIAKTGGHLASNLGVVELTVAIETVFNTEKDRLVFDVGHQSYVHKLLTGRQADFDTLRAFGGIAGFPKPSESVTDAFTAGHASSSVSVALGMARARTLQKQEYAVAALLGDGAATGGMVYEGLNDAAESGEPMVIILNDNEMSIDTNVGGMAKHLSRLRTKSGYIGAKRRYRSFLSKLPGGGWVYRVTRKMKNWIRRALISATIFENMGLTYFGPVDGHDLPSLIHVLQSAKDFGGPVLVHVLTRKGMGYAPAEDDPSKFHGVASFDPDTGNQAEKKSKSFSKAFGDCLCRLAEENDRVCAITAAMPGGTGLLGFKERFPQRLFDVGIAEEHAVSMAGGLAKQGMIPVVALYSTFLQRGFDQILQDVALQGLHVVFAVDRAGLVGEDGETHHGVFDIGFLRQIPGMQILAPATIGELAAMLRWAVNECDGPVAIRYPRGSSCIADGPGLGPDGLVCHRKGGDIAIITHGTITKQAMEAASLLEQRGVSCSVLRLYRLAPLNITALSVELAELTAVFVVEETASGSGLFESIAGGIAGRKCHRIDLGNKFVTHGDLESLYRHCGMDGLSIAQKIQEVLANEN